MVNKNTAELLDTISTLEGRIEFANERASFYDEGLVRMNKMLKRLYIENNKLKFPNAKRRYLISTGVFAVHPSTSAPNLNGMGWLIPIDVLNTQSEIANKYGISKSAVGRSIAGESVYNATCSKLLNNAELYIDDISNE